jgi:asparagine synthetase B (glutamine-hydrolysing)
MKGFVMQIRIVAGEINFDVNEMPLKLEVLYQSQNLIIQGDGDIQVIKLEDDRQAFIAGTIVGFRSQQNEIVSCSKESRLCRELIASNSIEDCQELFEGRYLLIVFGPGNECRICADRYSQFDLYYQRIGDTTYLGSNLECLPIYGKYSGFDQAGLIHALTVYGFRPPKRHTFYDGVQRLGVGELVHIRNGKVFMDTRPFKAIPTAIYGDRELNEYADLLLDAIRIRGSRYGNVVSLSSGWDSTSILACLVHIFGASKVRAVIGRMHYSKRAGIINQFEIDRAMAMAKYYNVHLDIVDLNYCEIGPDLLEKLQPILKSHCVSSISSISQAILYDFVARTGNGKEVLFVGEISDAVHNLGFSQFTSIFHPVLSFREYSDKMASFLFGPTFLKLMLTGDLFFVSEQGWFCHF